MRRGMFGTGGSKWTNIEKCCADCKGSGTKDGAKCARCNGTGVEAEK